MRLSIIVAAAQNGAIGRDNGLLWHLPEDFRWFKRHTSGHPVIMGRKTYESIGKVLPGRRNIILSRRPDFAVPGAQRFSELDEAIETLEREGVDEVFIIGGENIYRQALPRADRIYLTEVHRNFEGDAFFPTIPEKEFVTVFEERHESGTYPPLPARASGERERPDTRGDRPPAFTFRILDRVREVGKTRTTTG